VPGGGHGIFPRWAIDYLRYEFLEKREVQPRTGFERLYISRASASKRKLINEVEVMHYLHRFGFRSVTLETMPVTEHARLFASAKAVVAPHGAGLTNLMFCQPGTKVIEIFSPNHMHTCYPIISNHVKLDHYYLVGQGTRPPEYINPRNHADDITVNLKDLQHIMKMARLNR
jgi:capsular polysaccharide biosynthesis protein